MKINALLKVSTAFLLLFLLAVSCQKETITPEQTIRLQPETIELSTEFYQNDYLTSVNSHTLAPVNEQTTIPENVKSAFKVMDKREAYSADMIKNYGYPIWNRTYVVQDNEGQPLYFTPLAYEKGTSSSSFLLSTFNNGNHLFRHVKKVSLKQELEKATATISSETRLFVNFFLTADRDVFDNVDKELVGWLKMNKNGIVENESAASRSNCVPIELCQYAFQDKNGGATSRTCVTIYICSVNTGGVDGGGSCQECGDPGGFNGTGSGGSSSNSIDYSFDDESGYFAPNGDPVPNSIIWLNDNKSLFEKEEFVWLSNNNWAIKHVVSWINSGETIKERRRPDLGKIGNFIRNQLDSKFEKDAFDRYWLGWGDLHLSSTQFNAIIRAPNMKIQSSEIINQNNKPTLKHLVSSYSNSEYDAALGRFTTYQLTNPTGTLKGSYIGLLDFYDFDAKKGDNFFETIIGKTARSFSAEWKTRGVDMFSPSYSKPYTISYP